MTTARHRSVCLACGAADLPGFAPKCPRCDGMVDIVYPASSRIRAAESNPLRRYLEFLPIAEVDRAVWLGAPEPTPCVHARTLGDAIGHPRVYLKDETVCPTRTTKDRMAAIVLAWFAELGIKGFYGSSTGNSSTALALGMRHQPQMTLHLYCGEAFLHAMNWPDMPNVTLTVLAGATFVEAFELARERADGSGFVAERGFFNPGRREGLKLAFFEAAEQVPAPIDWYFQATSSGMGVYGTWKGAEELRRAGVISRMPRLACIQQESCAPMVHAWKQGAEKLTAEHVVANPRGIARAILRGDARQAYPPMRRIVNASGGVFESVREDEILAAQKLLVDAEGISACAAAACTVAGLRKLLAMGTVNTDETVLLNITGADRPPGHPSHYTLLTRSPQGWIEEKRSVGAPDGRSPA